MPVWLAADGPDAPGNAVWHGLSGYGDLLVDAFGNYWRKIPVVGVRRKCRHRQPTAPGHRLSFAPTLGDKVCIHFWGDNINHYGIGIRKYSVTDPTADLPDHPDIAFGYGLEWRLDRDWRAAKGNGAIAVQWEYGPARTNISSNGGSQPLRKERFKIFFFEPPTEWCSQLITTAHAGYCPYRRSVKYCSLAFTATLIITINVALFVNNGATSDAGTGFWLWSLGLPSYRDRRLCLRGAKKAGTYVSATGKTIAQFIPNVAPGAYYTMGARDPEIRRGALQLAATVMRR